MAALSSEGLSGLGVVACQVTGSPTPDTVASALIGLLLSCYFGVSVGAQIANSLSEQGSP